MKILHFTRPNSGSTDDYGSNLWSQWEQASAASAQFHDFISPAEILRHEGKQYENGREKYSLSAPPLTLLWTST